MQARGLPKMRAERGVKREFKDLVKSCHLFFVTGWSVKSVEFREAR